MFIFVSHIVRFILKRMVEIANTRIFNLLCVVCIVKKKFVLARLLNMTPYNISKEIGIKPYPTSKFIKILDLKTFSEYIVITTNKSDIKCGTKRLNNSLSTKQHYS